MPCKVNESRRHTIPRARYKVTKATAPNPYRGLRFPAEVNEHAVRLYHCFSLSLRGVETILAAAVSLCLTRASAAGACASAGCSPTR